MKKSLLPALFALLVIGLNTNASAQIYVNYNAAGANTGTSWANAYTDLQTALAAATAGDQIWVAAGTYKPAAPGGVSSSTFTLNKNLQLLGGFAGTESSAGQRDPIANPTILSGDLNGDDVDDDFSSATRSDNVQHVLSITATATVGTVVDGFTIQGGQADGGPSNNGAGVYCFGSPFLRDCIFRQNFCLGNGAGFYANGTAAEGLVIEQCRFEKNLAAISSGNARGGGMYLTNVKGDGFNVKESAFIGNTADWEGGLSIFNSNGIVEGTSFTGNVTKRHGGGLRINYQVGHDNLNFRVRNCSFENNKASFGGGMYGLISSQDCSIEVVNSKFIGNVVEDPMLVGWDNSYGGLGFSLQPAANNTSISVDSCLFEGNSTTANHSAFGIHTEAADTEVNIKNSTFRGNVNTGFWATVGIWPYAPTGSVNATIEHCLFENNSSVFTGGLDLGPLETDGDYVVRNCRFLNNQAIYGGALTLFANQGSKVNYVVEDCEMDGNSALARAGAIWILSSCEDFNARIDRCTIRNNDCPGGSAIGFNGDDPTQYPITTLGPDFAITNCLIEGNTSGAAIAGDSLRGMRLINCTVANNHGGIVLADSSSIQLQNTILYNPGHTEYEALTSDVAFTSNGGNLIGDGSLGSAATPWDLQNTDPLFVAPGDFHLSASSPGIDKGVDLDNLSATDLDGNARVVSCPDIGAYESATVVSTDCVVGSGEGFSGIFSVTISPNPTSDFLNIQLPESIAPSLNVQVFDTQGRLVRNQMLAEGQPLDVQGLAAGMYTLKVLAGERVYVGKFVRQ